MSKKELSIIIVLLIGLNLFLAYSNYSKKAGLKAHTSSEEPTEFFSDNNTNELVISSNTNFIVNPDINIPETGYKLLVFIDEAGCHYCIEKEVELLNELDSVYSNNLDVYFLSNNPSTLSRLYNAKFDYGALDRDVLITGAEIQIHNPVSFLIDNSGLIQIAHFAEKDNPGKSEIFYGKMTSFFVSMEN